MNTGMKLLSLYRKKKTYGNTSVLNSTQYFGTWVYQILWSLKKHMKNNSRRFSSRLMNWNLIEVKELTRRTTRTLNASSNQNCIFPKSIRSMRSLAMILWTSWRDVYTNVSSRLQKRTTSIWAQPSFSTVCTQDWCSVLLIHCMHFLSSRCCIRFKCRCSISCMHLVRFSKE